MTTVKLLKNGIRTSNPMLCHYQRHMKVESDNEKDEFIFVGWFMELGDALLCHNWE